MKLATALAGSLIAASLTGCSTESAKPVVGPDSVGSDQPQGALSRLAIRDGTGARFDALGRSLDGGEGLEPLAGYN